jgi:exosortase
MVMTVAQDINPGQPARRLPISAAGLILLTGLLSLVAPTVFSLSKQDWSTEQGEQGPLVLVLGLWLLWRVWPDVRRAGKPGAPAVAASAGLLAGLVYLLGRVADQILIETYGLYLLGLVAVYSLHGFRGMRAGGFAFFYLLFALPAPYTVMWTLTSHLRLWVTEAAVAFYHVMGFSIVRNGLDILVDQYDLAVKEACSGMNSLISLSAICLLYLHLRRRPPAWYYVALSAPIVAFAIAGNLVRVLVLIALTHYFGDAVAQSYLHQAAGAVTFMTALTGVIALDAVAAKALPSREPKP